MSESLEKRVRDLEAQLALRDLENADLRETIADLDGRNPNPEFRSLRSKLEEAQAASASADQRIGELDSQIEILRYDLGAKEGELVATREALCEEGRRAAALEAQMSSPVRAPAATHEIEGASSLAS